MWADILSRVVHRRGVPVSEQSPVPALAAEPEAAETGLAVSLRWFLGLRWLAVAAVVAATLIAKYALLLELPLLPLIAMAAALAGYNLLLRWLALQIDRGSPVAPFQSVRRLAHLHISLDLAALTAIIHFSGGVENPFSYFYIFHVVFAGLFLSRIAAFAYASASIVLLTSIATAESLALIPHYRLEGFADPGLYQHGLQIATLILGFALTLLFVAYLTSSIGSHLRARERELELVNQQLRQQTMEVQEANSKLEKLIKMRSAPTLLVAHELRAPLTAIQGLMDVTLQGYISDPEERRDALRMARDRAAGLIAVVSDLLCLGQIREIGPTMPMGPVDLASVLDDICNTVGSEATLKGIDLKRSVESNLPPVRGNREQLAQLLLNLVDNAIKYTPSGGRVIVSLRQEAGSVIGEVRDTGIGIDPADLERIFEDFYRAENAKRVKEIGTGLGLGIVRRVIELHSGQLTVQSHLGRGTVFTFSLPCSRASTVGSHLGDRHNERNGRATETHV